MLTLIIALFIFIFLVHFSILLRSASEKIDFLIDLCDEHSLNDDLNLEPLSKNEIKTWNSIMKNERFDFDDRS